MVKISIIVPMYRVERYLPRCLDSLISQSFPELEIICVNDGSPDGCAEIVKQYSEHDGRVKLVNRENGGLSAARNTGMAVAAGPYLMFVDPDDWVGPRWCESLYAAITEASADLAVGEVRCESEDDRESAAMQKAFRHHGRGTVSVVPEVLLSTDVSACDKLFRRDIIESSGLRFLEGLRHEDEFFYWEYMSFAKRIAYTGSVGYHYVLRGDSITGVEGRDREALFDYLNGATEVLNRLVRICAESWYVNAYARNYLVTVRSVFTALSDDELGRAFACCRRGLDILDNAGPFGRRESAVLQALKTGDRALKGRRRRYLGGLVQVKSDICRSVVYFLGLPVGWKRRRDDENIR